MELLFHMKFTVIAGRFSQAHVPVFTRNLRTIYFPFARGSISLLFNDKVSERALGTSLLDVAYDAGALSRTP